MVNGMSMVTWIQLPHSLRALTGGNWQERCYPFRGVFAAERSDSATERRWLLEDCRLAIQEFEEESERIKSRLKHNN